MVNIGIFFQSTVGKTVLPIAFKGLSPKRLHQGAQPTRDGASERGTDDSHDQHQPDAILNGSRDAEHGADSYCNPDDEENHFLIPLGGARRCVFAVNIN